MSTVIKRWTYDDLAAMPEDNVIREIFDGELFVSPSPFTRHQRIVGRLFLAISNYVEEHPIGEVFVSPLDTVFSIDNVCDPDVLFVSHERSSIVTKKHLHGSPDFVVEVLSEFNRKNDEVRKLAIYERFDVTEYWIVDPEKNTIRVFRRNGKALPLVNELAASAGDVATTPIFPGLTIELTELFR
ncbi:MAG TPA: Uma2 family endonuclease [Thermoanaerobaculia bacterium]|nr:Uma2 family endonuclease [Thermoanaerobaculia bacterium]